MWIKTHRYLVCMKGPYLINASYAFLRDFLLAWSKLTNKTVISNYHDEIIWNNSNIRVGEKTIFYKEGFQLGIKHIKDIFMTNKTKDTTPFITYKRSSIYRLLIFLRYMSLINSIPKDRKYKLKQEIQHVHMESYLLKQIKKIKHMSINLFTIIL